MSTSREYIQFVLDQLDGIEDIMFRKMFGEYMIYIEDKPVITVCDNTVFVKRLPELADLMKSAPTGVPYSGSKEHYILDMDDTTSDSTTGTTSTDSDTMTDTDTSSDASTTTSSSTSTDNSDTTSRSGSSENTVTVD